MKYLALLTTTLFLAQAAPCVLKRHTSLAECLIESQVPIVESCSTGWNQIIEPFNLRTNYTPLLLAVPESVEHVAASVKCAAGYGAKVQARGGGHSYAAMGLGGQDGSLVVDMKKFKSMSLKSDVVTVGAGVRLGDLATFLWNNGKRALPHGLCPGYVTYLSTTLNAGRLTQMVQCRYCRPRSSRWFWHDFSYVGYYLGQHCRDASRRCRWLSPHHFPDPEF